MDAMTTERPTIGHNAGRMTEAEYDRERAKIAPTKQQAGIRWEQDLARLFYRSGWTKAELGKRERRTGQNVGQLVKFGEFLTFIGHEINNSSLEKLTRGHFTKLWNETARGRMDKTGLYDRERFREVLQRMRAEGYAGGRKPPLPPDTTAKIIKKCGDGKWRSPAQIASKVGLDAENVGRIPHLIQHHKHRADVESKKVGTETHYRIFKKDKTISSDELVEKLAPIVEGLELEGRKNMATASPAQVAILANQLKKLLKLWTE